MSEKQGVEIDYCPECRGIWLDRGELEKIIDRSAQNFGDSHKNQTFNNEHSEKQYKHGHNDHHYSSNGDRKHKKKSFLEDIFDFG